MYMRNLGELTEDLESEIREKSTLGNIDAFFIEVPLAPRFEPSIVVWEDLTLNRIKEATAGTVPRRTLLPGHVYPWYTDFCS